MFRVVGEAFASLPTVKTVVCSGFAHRADPTTGKERDDYLLSVRVTREAWSRIAFANLAHVDPIAELSNLDYRCDCSASECSSRSSRSRGSRADRLTRAMRHALTRQVGPSNAEPNSRGSPSASRSVMRTFPGVASQLGGPR
jgi:hypothetical protein